MANSDVWINGFHLGKRPYGYVSFRYELTGHLNCRRQRARRSRRQLGSSRRRAGIPGAGIYRHVRLVVTDPVHLDHWSTFVTTPEGDRRPRPPCEWQTSVRNQSDAAAPGQPCK